MPSITETGGVVASQKPNRHPRVVEGADELRALVGQFLGYSDWIEIDQERVNRFAEATGDHQWIHVDPDRAARESPFGGTIAHGYLTLSLGPALLPTVVQITGFDLGVNYGSNRVRFTSPVRVGSRLRLGVTLASVEDIPNGVQTCRQLQFETEGSDRPACVAEVVGRRYRSSTGG
jgi:acyl dehydratase